MVKEVYNIISVVVNVPRPLLYFHVRATLAPETMVYVPSVKEYIYF